MLEPTLTLNPCQLFLSQPLENDRFSTPIKFSGHDKHPDKENESKTPPDTSKKQSKTPSNHTFRPKPAGDRFIPLRSSAKSSFGFKDIEVGEEVSSKSASNKKSGEESPSKDQTSNLMNSFLRSGIFGLNDSSENDAIRFQNHNMLRFGQQTRAFDPNAIVSSFDIGISPSEKKKSQPRKIPSAPFKVLDAPALQDDFYLNLLDWSDSNLLSVGLASCVYLWSGCNNRVFKVCDLGSEDTVTSVGWAKKGQLLSVGTNLGEVHIWDINKVKRIRTLEGHTSRVGALAWSDTCLASGSRDKSILLRDVRSPESFHERILGHKQEVCGLKWSFDDQMFSSGGNDNKMFIWTARSPNPIFKTNVHKAAVKALAWSPHQHGLLASGGGTADKCIRFWSAQSGKMINCVDTGSQVCNLLFAKNQNELVSTHGYTENQIHLWTYPHMKKISTLTGHSFRVLFLAMSPDGRSIVTGAGDETLRFWNLYPKGEDKDGESQNELMPISKISIR